jgi:glycosyltransferase involved in cell wall biosynthesis
MNKVTAVIPAYNEAGRIARTLEQVAPYVDEIVVVDDASVDATAEIAGRFGAKVFSQPENSGYIEAIKLGFSKATGEIIITVDADGEFPAESIPDLIKPVEDGQADMVQGSRNIIPRPSERFLTWLAMRKSAVGDSGTGMRAIRADLAKSLEIKGACICGVLSLEVASKGGVLSKSPSHYRKSTSQEKLPGSISGSFFTSWHGFSNRT